MYIDTGYSTDSPTEIPKNGNETGWSDLSTDTEMMRFIYPGNLVGLPAISFPIGYDTLGLPISMQAIGRYWEENVFLRVAFNAERAFKPQLPKIYFKCCIDPRIF